MPGLILKLFTKLYKVHGLSVLEHPTHSPNSQVVRPSHEYRLCCLRYIPHGTIDRVEGGLATEASGSRDVLQRVYVELRNNPCFISTPGKFRPHVGSKPQLKPRGNTDGTSSVPRFQSLSTQSMMGPYAVLEAY